MLESLLWKNKSKLNLYGAALATFFGLLMLLMALQFYLTVNSIMKHNSNYVIVNKKVSLMDTGLKFVGVDAGVFFKEEIEDVKNQPFTIKVAPFASGRFRVQARMEEMGFYSDLFFQSLPDEFLDFQEPAFKWKEGDEEIPIVLSKDYLSLYNFAFAPSLNLPPFTPKTIAKVVFIVRISGRGVDKMMKGRVVGFSPNINSILVPHSFMEYANVLFGDTDKPVKQLFMQVDNPYSATFAEYLKSKNMEVGTGIGDRIGAFASVTTPILVFLGLIITILALLVFMLNFRLIVAESAQDIRLLLQIGYKQGAISGLLQKKFFVQMAVTLAFVLVAIFGAQWVLGQWFNSQGFEASTFPSPIVLGAAFALGFVFLWLNYRSVNKSVERCR